MTELTPSSSDAPGDDLPVERGVVMVTFDTAQILDVTGPLGAVLQRLSVPGSTSRWSHLG